MTTGSQATTDFIVQHAIIGMNDTLVAKALKRQLGVEMTAAQVQRVRKADGRAPRHLERSQRTGMAHGRQYIPDHRRLIRWLWSWCGWSQAEIAKRLDRDGIRTECTASAVAGLIHRQEWTKAAERKDVTKLLSFSQLVVKYGCTKRERELFEHAGVLVPGYKSHRRKRGKRKGKKPKAKARSNRSAEAKAPKTAPGALDLGEVTVVQQMAVKIDQKVIERLVVKAATDYANPDGRPVRSTKVVFHYEGDEEVDGATVYIEVEGA